MSMYTFASGSKKKINKVYTFINGTKKRIHTIYTFINGTKYYLLKRPKLTVNPTLSSATVTFNTSGAVSGNSISVYPGTTVSYTLTASGHDTRTLSQYVGESDVTVTPTMHVTVTSPVANTGTGVFPNITSWVSRGQGIKAGTYTYSRAGGSYTNTWTVTVNNRGEVQSISASGNIRSTSSSSNVTITPTGGWTDKDVWE